MTVAIWDYMKTLSEWPALTDQLLECFKWSGYGVAGYFGNGEDADKAPTVMWPLAAKSIAYLIGNVYGADGMPNFERSIDQPEAKSQISSWFAANGKETGRLLYTNFVTERLADYLKKKGADFEAEKDNLKTLLGEESFLNGIDTEDFVTKTILPVQTLLAFALKNYGKTFLDSIRKQWDSKTVELSFRLADDGIAFFEKFREDDGQAYYDLLESKYSGDVQSTATTKREVPQVTPKYLKYSYGSTVYDWLQAEKAILTDIYIMEPDYIYTNKGSLDCCFVPGTPVTVLSSNGIDLKRVPIEDIRKGDLVVSHNGSLAVASDEPVTHIVNGSIVVYGFASGDNDEFIEPFFAESHPFWTAEGGWCSPSPIASNLENSFCKTKKLLEGSTVYRASAEVTSPYNVSIEYTPFPITKLVHKMLHNPAVCGLHFREGMRSYHANDFLVGLNYPELTGSRVVRLLTNSSHVSVSQRIEMMEGLKSAATILTTAVGSNWPGVVLRSVYGAGQAGPDSGDRDLYYHQMTAARFRTTHITSVLGKLTQLENSTSPAGFISIANGKVAINGAPSESTSFADDGSIVAVMPGGRHLLIQMHSFGLGGRVVETEFLEDISVVPSVGTAAPDTFTSTNTYTFTSRNTYDVSYTDKNGATKSWYSVITELNDSQTPVAYAYDPKGSAARNEKLRACTETFSVNQDQLLQITFNFRFLDPYDWYDGEVVISDNFQTLSGTIYAGTDTGKGDAVEMHGKIAEEEFAATQGVGEEGSAPGVPRQPLSNAFAAADKANNALKNLLPLTASALADIKLPHPDLVQKLSAIKLVRLAKASVDPSVLEDTLDEKPPQLHPDERAILENSEFGRMTEIFLDQLFTAYVMQAATASRELEDIFPGGVSAAKDKLNHYWHNLGNPSAATAADANVEKNSPSPNDCYLYLISQTARLAVIDACPEISSYLESPGEWADRLYLYVTETNFLNRLTFSKTWGPQKFNEICAIFHALVPEGEYPAMLASKIQANMCLSLSMKFRSLQKSDMAEAIHDISGALSFELNVPNHPDFFSPNSAQGFWESIADILFSKKHLSCSLRLKAVWQWIDQIQFKEAPVLKALSAYTFFVLSTGAAMASLVSREGNWALLPSNIKAAVVEEGIAVVAKRFGQQSVFESILNNLNINPFEIATDMSNLVTALEEGLRNVAVMSRMSAVAVAGLIAADETAGERFVKLFDANRVDALLTNSMLLTTSIASTSMLVTLTVPKDRIETDGFCKTIIALSVGLIAVAERLIRIDQAYRQDVANFLSGAVSVYSGTALAVAGLIRNYFVIFYPKLKIGPSHQSWIVNKGIPFIAKLPTSAAPAISAE